jgi:hypothetical protein
MTFPWVFETIARARQEEIRTAVADHHYAQEHRAQRNHSVRRRGSLTMLRAHLVGPRVVLRLVPSGPESRRAARTRN